MWKELPWGFAAIICAVTYVAGLVAAILKGTGDSKTLESARSSRKRRSEISRQRTRPRSRKLILPLFPAVVAAVSALGNGALENHRRAVERQEAERQKEKARPEIAVHTTRSRPGEDSLQIVQKNGTVSFFSLTYPVDGKIRQILDLNQVTDGQVLTNRSVGIDAPISLDTAEIWVDRPRPGASLEFKIFFETSPAHLTPFPSTVTSLDRYHFVYRWEFKGENQPTEDHWFLKANDSLTEQPDMLVEGFGQWNNKVLNEKERQQLYEKGRNKSQDFRR